MLSPAAGTTGDASPGTATEREAPLGQRSRGCEVRVPGTMYHLQVFFSGSNMVHGGSRNARIARPAIQLERYRRLGSYDVQAASPGKLSSRRRAQDPDPIIAQMFHFDNHHFLGILAPRAETGQVGRQC